MVNIVRLISLRGRCFFGSRGVLDVRRNQRGDLHLLGDSAEWAAHYIVFTGGFSMLIFGLLAAAEMILYSLVQILEQGKGAAVGRSGGVAE